MVVFLISWKRFSLESDSTEAIYLVSWPGLGCTWFFFIHTFEWLALFLLKKVLVDDQRIEITVFDILFGELVWTGDTIVEKLTIEVFKKSKVGRFILELVLKLVAAHNQEGKEYDHNDLVLKQRLSGVCHVLPDVDGRLLGSLDQDFLVRYHHLVLFEKVLGQLKVLLVLKGYEAATDVSPVLRCLHQLNLLFNFVNVLVTHWIGGTTSRPELLDKDIVVEHEVYLCDINSLTIDLQIQLI